MDLTLFFAHQDFCWPFFTGLSALNSNAIASLTTSHISEINHFFNQFVTAAYCARSGAGY